MFPYISTFFASHPALALVMQTSFQNLQAELNSFLDIHTEKTLALQASLSSMEQRAKLNMRLSVQDTG